MRIVIKGGVWKNTEVRKTRKKVEEEDAREGGGGMWTRERTRAWERKREREHRRKDEETNDEVLTSGQRDDERMRSSKQP